RDHRELLSFPTRRSSDLGALVAEREIARARAQGEETPVVLRNLLTSRIVEETIEAAGGRAVRTPVGHSGIKRLMREHDAVFAARSEEHTSELQSRENLVC